MKKFMLFAFILLDACLLLAQTFVQAQAVAGNGAPTFTCPANNWVYFDYTNSVTYQCSTGGGSYVLEAPARSGFTSQKAETGAADASLLAVTPASSAGTYRACYTASVSSATSGVIGFTLSWTDSNGNAQSNIALPLQQAGTAAPANTFTTSAAGNYSNCFSFDVNNAGAVITVKWVGGGTSAAKASAELEKLI